MQSNVHKLVARRFGGGGRAGKGRVAESRESPEGSPGRGRGRGLPVMGAVGALVLSSILTLPTITQLQLV